jgi:RNA polymerase-binding transcription factor DksA
MQHDPQAAPESPSPARQVDTPSSESAPGTPLDLDAIERDLADVESALARLEAGTYWTDEVTGEPLDDSHLAQHPTARTAAG